MAALTPTQSQHYDLLILGAGMSGLACASRLYEHEHFKKKNRLLVLEGRERIGGRIEAVHSNGCRLDTGANWIHGVGTEERPNPLMGVLPHKRYRSLSGSVIFRAPHDELEDDIEGTYEQSLDHQPWVKVPSPRLPLHGDGPRRDSDMVIPKNVAEKLMGSLWSMVGSLHEAAAEDLEKAKDTPMLQAIIETEELGEAYEAAPEEYHRSISAIPQFLENMEAAPLAAQSAENPAGHRGMSLLEFGIDDFEGDQVFLQDGYAAVIDEVAKELKQDDLIQLGVRIKRIDWTKSLIKVETSSGLYTAKQVVCSLPLGVLQHHTEAPSAIFVPPLPSEKQSAIKSLGFGTLDKVMLVYQAAWWTEEPYMSIFQKGLIRRPLSIDAGDVADESDGASPPDTIMGFTGELPGIEIHEDGTTTPGLRILSLINLDSLTGFPALSAFVSCANAVQVEAMTDKQAGGMVHRALTSWLGREPPRPDAVHVSRWAADEFARGSYSHMITGLSTSQHREEFQQPVVNRDGGVLRFAGEHTSRDHFATVHGALLSGWREADAVLEEL